MFNAYIMQRNHEHRVPVLKLPRQLPLSPGDQLVLDEDEGFHGVVQGQVVLGHLGEDCADVQVDLTGVGNFDTFFYRKGAFLVDASVFQI